MLAGNRLGFQAVVSHRGPFCGGGFVRPRARLRGASRRQSLYPLRSSSSQSNAPPWPEARGMSGARVMSQLSKVKYSRNQWKHKATQRGDRDRYQRKQIARITAERDRATQALKEAQARLRQFESQPQGLVALPKVDVVFLALQLFLVARIGFRAVSRVLSLLAWVLGIKKAPCPHTIINGVRRLSIVRIEAARRLKGFPLSQAPCTHGLLWLLDLRIGLGTGKMLAVWACEAHAHHLTPGALSLDRVHGMGGAVPDAWTGGTTAALLGRLIAQMGRPAAYRKDGGSDLHKAVAILGEHGLASPCIDDIAPAVAGMLKRLDQAHPSFATFLSACGRVSGTRKHTLLACLAPPLPTYKPKPDVCMGIVYAPGPIACCSSRQLAVPKGARPEPSGARAWSNCPPAKPSSRGVEAMPRLCLPARRGSKPTGSLTTPSPSVSRASTPYPHALDAWSFTPLLPSSLRPPRPSGSSTSACRSAPMPSHRFLGSPSHTVWGRPRRRLASPCASLLAAVFPLARKPSRSFRSAWPDNKS